MTDEELQAKFLYDNGTLRNKFAIGRVSYVTTIFQRQVLIFWNMVVLIMQLNILMMKLDD